MESPDDTNLEEAEKAYYQNVLLARGADVSLIDNSTLHINHGLALVSGHEQEFNDRLVRMLLFTRAFNSLVWARKSLFTGYVVQALLLTRSAMEDWGSGAYVRHHPEEALLWLEAQEDWSGPGFAQIWEDAPDDEEIAQRLETTTKLKTLYGYLSLFAHPRAAGLPYLVSWDAEQTYFHAGPARQWDAEKFETGLYFLLYVIQGFFAAVDRITFDVTGELQEGWRNRALELTDLMRQRVASIEDRVQGRIDTAAELEV